MDENTLPIGPASISENHPLRRLFHNLVAHTFQNVLGWEEQTVSHYLAEMLTEFTHEDNLYRIRDGRGCRLLDVVSMQMEADVAANAVSFDQERMVHKHIGDFTLFWAGVYPETLQQQRARGLADHLLDYVRQGKQSYYIVSTFQHGRYAEDADLFRTLSKEFELCLYGLGLVRRDWERLSARRPM